MKTDKPITIGEMGSMYYSTPDCIYTFNGERTYQSFDGRLEAIGREAFEDLKQHRKWAAQVCIFNMVHYGLYPLPIDERILSYDSYSTPGIKPTKIGPYISTLNAGYDPSLPDYMPNPVFKWVKKAYIPERFFFEDNKTGFYAGTRVKKLLSVFNDSLDDHVYSMSWKLEEKPGETVCASGSLEAAVPASEYRMIEIEFTLPASAENCSYSLEVEMSEEGRGLVFSDSQLLGVSDAELIASDISSDTRIAFVNWNSRNEAGDLKEENGSKADADKKRVYGNRAYILKEYWKKSKDNIEFCDESDFNWDCDVYILCGRVNPSLYDSLMTSGKRVLDISLAGRDFSKWSQRNPVHKLFLNSNDEVLKKGLDEEDLCCWNNGPLTEYSLVDYINANVRYLAVNGKGTPVISQFITDRGQYILSAVDLVSRADDSPAALRLLVNLINLISMTADKRIKQSQKAILVSSENSRLSEFLRTINADCQTVLPDNKEQIKKLFQRDSILIIDGSSRFDFIEELTGFNAKTVLVWGLTRDTMPLAFKGRIDAADTSLNQLVKAGSDIAVDCVHDGDLYGLEAGNEIAIAEKPVFIYDECFAKGLLKNADINWVQWNMQGEDKKTAAILRDETAQKPDLYGFAKLRLNGMDVYISQLSLNANNYKSKKLACMLLTNLGARINSREIDEFSIILNDGVYSHGIKKALMLGPVENLNPERVSPALNKSEGGSFWNIAEFGNHQAKGRYLYGIYVYSPSDRTDLLLNPDLISVQINSRFEKSLYLNHEMIAQGREISLNGLRLKAGWNLMVLSEDRDDGAADSVSAVFTRKDNRPLDLLFSMDTPGVREIPNDKWVLHSNFHDEDCRKALEGRGSMWDSEASQAAGMYFSIDLNDVYNVAKLQFSGKILKSDHIQWNTPRCFTVYSSLDGEAWEAVGKVPNEDRLTVADGKLIMNFHPFKARFLKLFIDDVANKRLMISELKIFAA